MADREGDALKALDEFCRGKTLARVDYPVSMASEMTLYFTDGSSATFGLEPLSVRELAPAPPTPS